MSIIKSRWFSINEDLKTEQTENNDDLFFDIDSNNNRVDTQNNIAIAQNDIRDTQNDIVKKIELLEQKIEEYKNTNMILLSSIEELKKKIDIMFEDDIHMKSIIEQVNSKVKQNETACNIVRNENLKLINRILEAEISVERTTNILLRKNISFPFTKINL